MLAGSEALRQANPRLLEWTSRQFRLWRQREQDIRLFSSTRRFVLIAALSGLADLRLHAGLMQLLNLLGTRADLVLTLPTDDALRIAKAEARREAWLGLVTMVLEADLTTHLAPDQTVGRFAGPAVLTQPQLARLQALLLSRPLGELFEVEHFAFGRFEAVMEHSEQRSLSPAAFAGLLALDPGTLGDLEPDDRAVLDRTTAATIEQVLPNGARVVLPPLLPEHELIITVEPKDGSGQVIARISGNLDHGRRQVRLLPPAALLTTNPQPLRLEVKGGDGGLSATELHFHVSPSQLEPWMLSAFLNRGGAGNPVVDAFAAGTGCRLAFAEDEPDRLSDIPVVWGVLRQSDRILDQAKRQSLYYFYIDHAYFDRGHGHSYRIARNAYEAGPVRACPSDRFDALGVTVAPWRKGGREIVVCPPTEYFMHAHGCEDWLETTLARLKTSTDRPIVVRVKPKPGEAAVPLPQALTTAHALVTHSSNVAIESACLGTPVFVSAASAAAPVGLTDVEAIETPAYPERAAWLAHLAYSQYSLAEIREGRAWRLLRDLELRDLV